MDDKLARLEAVVVRLENLARQQSSNNQTASNDDNSADAIDQTPIIRDYQYLITDSLQPFLNLSQKIGGDVTTMTEYVSRLFNAQQEFLRQAVQSKKPDDKTIQTAIGAQSTEIGNITDFTSKNRKSPLFNHLSAISEGIPALGWILVAPTPAPHIKDTVDSAQFYSNRVLKDYKEKDQTHVDWVKAWIKVLNDLHAYVKQYHTTGLAWGSQGKRDFGSISAAAGPAKSAPTSAATTAPPPPPPPAGGPPPPPPPPPPSASSASATSVDDGRNDLMNSINSLGEGVTSRLKKVPDSLKTHKNPDLRQQADDQSAKGKKPPPPPARTGKIAVAQPTKAAPVNPPKLVLEGNKWVVEYHNGNSNVRITETEMKHTIYIYKCTNSTIIVEGKVNSIVLDQCTKVGIQFTSVVSLVEFVNCKSMKAQVTDRVPTIQIEKTDGCHVYLSSTSLDTEFITSKSSEMSVNIPIDDGEYKELPIAEQFKTFIKNGSQLVTVANESAGV